MTEIIDGKALAKKIRENLKKDVDELKKEGIKPKFAVILVGDDPASKIYVRNKNRACNEIGIEYEEHLLPENTTMEELLALIDELNEDKSINGVLLQSPLPKHLDINEAFKKIDYRKDVDGFNPINVGKLALGQDCFVSCTPYGIVKMIEEYNIPTEGKKAVIIGRSNIVGKPLIQCLLSKNATVTICHSKTKEIEKITKDADIIVNEILDSIPTDVALSIRRREAKLALKKKFMIDRKKPSWVQEPEWPVVDGQPLRFVEQRHDGELFLYEFINDRDKTINVIEQLS